PAMVRSAAKNHANVAIVVSPLSYPQVTKALALGGTTLAQRQRLAGEAFAHTAAYDTAVATWFAENVGLLAERAHDGVPPTLDLTFGHGTQLRYGENSHQTATLYRADHGHGIAQAEQMHGKEMSYNNYVDADAALRAAYDFTEPAVAIIKHANPCGIAVADDVATAHRLAHECDPVSAFGGVIAANRPIDVAAAESIKDIFTEVIVAPDFTREALAVLTAKKNLRILRLPADYAREPLEWRQLSGGVLAQAPDTHFAAFADWSLVSGAAADAALRADLEFAWRAVRAVKSNAILLARGGASVGVGMGQVNRVDSCRLAVERAGERARGSVAASDAFFPFADGLQVLLDAGVDAVVQPGGSVRDDEVIAAAQAAGVTMYFTGERHFFH
ncbi:MAG: bifunctional phosphoribosylaminoimidazolecarboxamide formyltransferase/IMP cyclohydrolase, partial [Terrimesophilobacter sp.]